MDTVIVSAIRTPIGKFCGGLSTVAAPKLGASVVREAKAKLEFGAGDVDEIIMGQVLPAGVGQAPARQAAIFGGLDDSVCALTINKVCGSGLKACMLADQAIRLGAAKVVFAGGQESMSLAPYLLPNVRTGWKFGDATAVDHMLLDGLVNVYDGSKMGSCAELCATEHKFSREAQDELARTSYERARLAAESGWFKNEIVPVTIPGKKGDRVVDQDEQPFSVDLDRISTLPPAFAKDGVVTAGNSSALSDGAAVLVLMSSEEAKRRKLQPLARVVDHASAAAAPEWFTTAPVAAIQKLLDRQQLQAKDIDLFEINEAFSVVSLYASQKLQLDDTRVNVCGGAIALGHPIGASGARILTTLIHNLERLQVRRGIASLCIGGGEASAMLVERCD